MSVNTEKITKRFEQDLTAYKPIPFWSWNDKLELDELRRQIEWMNEVEIGGFFMHARGGLKTEYLSEEWMECIEACAEHAEKLGMDAWAYDENGWPSGFAGGKLLEDPNNCDRYILSDIGAFDPNATVSYLLDDEKLIRATDGKADGEYLNIHIITAVSTADILNPEVMDKFIGLTHEAYKARFGEDFSKKIKGFFTDEPQYQRWHTPFSNMMFNYFETEYGVDILDEIGLLFVEKKGYRRFRYRYWKAMQHLMLEGFAKKIHKWCKDNGVSFTGHYIEEGSLSGQMLACAGIMPFYAHMDMPGIDWLGRKTENMIPARQLASVAAQFDKRQTLTETFGCCGWQITPTDVKRIADFQFLGGVNMLCHHLVPYSEHGQRKKDYPAHYTSVNPWVEREFADFNRYYTRLGHLISESEEKVNVAMLHPIRSTYFTYKREHECNISELDNIFYNDCRFLTSRGIAFHLLDETLMAEHGFVKGNKIGCGKCDYDYLILPHILTMDASTEKLLHNYVENGGKVLVLGEMPTFCEAEPFDYSYITPNCTIEDIIATQPFRMSDCNIDSQLYAAYREIDGQSFMFIQNSSETQTDTKTFYLGENIRSFKKIDLITLEEKNIPLTVTLEPGESVFVMPDSAEPDVEKTLKEYCLILENAAVSCKSNQLTVDYVRYSKNGVDYSERYPCAGLFAKLLEERYVGDIYIKYEFDVRKVPSKLRLAAEDCNASDLWLNGKPFTFTEKSEKEKALLVADVSNLVTEGINEFIIKLNWYQDESVFYALFGENVTESLRNCLVYDTDLEAIYLSGDFGVYSDTEYFDSDTPDFVYGNNFYIGEMPATVTEPTTQGFPFFAGSLTVSQKIMLETADAALRINGTWHAAYIKVNGNYAGKLLYGQVCDISEFAVEGENTIEIEFLIGNRNLLGPHHRIVEDEHKSVSPTSFTLDETKWKNGNNPKFADRYSLIKLNCR